MKKIFLAFITVYVFSLAAVLCACGAGLSAPADSSEPPPEAVYIPSESKIDFDGYDLTPIDFGEKGFYACGLEKTGEKIPQEIIDEAKKKDTKPVNDGRWDVYSEKLYFIGADGKTAELKKYKTLSEAENTEGWEKFSSVSSISGGAVDSNGDLVLIEKTMSSGKGTGEDGTGKVKKFRTSWYIRLVNGKTGRVLSSEEIDNKDGASFSPSVMLFSGGYALVKSESSFGSGVALIDLNGKVENTALYGGHIDKILQLGDGRPAIYGRNNSGKKIISLLDTETGFYTDAYEIPEAIKTVYSGGGNYLFYYVSDYDFCGYSVSLETGVKLFNLLEANVNPRRISSEVSSDSAGSIFLISGEKNRESGEEANVLARMERDDTAESKSDKTNLVLLSSQPGDDLLDEIAAFNRESGAVSVELQTYAPGLYADIVDLSGLSYKFMAARGELADLYSYLDSDPELKREDYFPNVLSMLTTDGKLCCTCSGFIINTVLAPERAVPNANEWTYDSCISALGRMTEGCKAFDIYTTSSDVLAACLTTDIDSFVDLKNLTCGFESDKFISMLEFAGRFPYEFNGNISKMSAKEYSSDQRIRDGRQMLLPASLCSFEDVMRSGFEFREPFVWAGYPTLTGTGNTLSISTLATGGNLAIPASSEHADAAWQFLRRFFTPAYQKSRSLFPSCISAFDDMIAEAEKTEYLKDKNGKIMYDSQTDKPLIRAKGTVYMSDFEQVKYYPIDSRRAEMLYELIRSSQKSAENCEDIVSTACESASGYFSGSCSAWDAAEKVQSAVSSFLQAKGQTG